MEPQILPAPAGYEIIEVMGDTYFRSAMLAVAYHPQHGVKPLGISDRLEDARHQVALVLPDGRVEHQGEWWPTVAAFLNAKGIEGLSDAA